MIWFLLVSSEHTYYELLVMWISKLIRLLAFGRNIGVVSPIQLWSV